MASLINLHVYPARATGARGDRRRVGLPTCVLTLGILLASQVMNVNAAASGAPAYAEFHSADGTRTIAARLVDVVSLEQEIVRMESKDSGIMDVSVKVFSAGDRIQLKRWMEKVENDPRTKLTRRMLAARQPAVLFIGNSYSFQVPVVFGQIARKEGRNVVVEQVTKGGWSLAQHASNADTLAKIRSRKWDAVVIQEQSLIPSFPAEQRDELMLPPLKALVAEIARAGAQPALYQTWARRDGDRQNAAVFPNDNFEAMAKRLEECFAAARQAVPEFSGVPVGAAWTARMSVGKGASLYNPDDGSHPSAQGNYLAAAVFYSTFFNTRVATTPGGIDDAAALNDLAAEVGRRRLPPYPLPAD